MDVGLDKGVWLFEEGQYGLVETLSLKKKEYLGTYLCQSESLDIGQHLAIFLSAHERQDTTIKRSDFFMLFK